MITKFEKGSLFTHIHNYLKVYLPKQRNLSPHTINSYREALEQLVDFVKMYKQIPLQYVTFEMLNAETITAFLDWIETSRGCSISTRNNRLAAVRAFIKYTADRDITTVSVLKELKHVTVKKPNQAVAIGYISMTAITAIVEQTDTSTSLGLRDRTFLILMYDTGARVTEMVSIKLHDLRFGRTPTINLNGKGGKVRTVPLLEKTVQHLKKYLAEFHNDRPLASDFPLFYTTTHGEPHSLSDRRIRYLLKDYATKARKYCHEVPEKVFPHIFRHSRAMHLYQNGMDLTLVSQWLGHANLETTQIYAHADTEHKRKAIAAATPSDNPLFSKLNPERYTATDEETLKRLSGLN
jgi:site-specific recombinase XerD